MVTKNPQLYKMTDQQLVGYALTIRDPLLVTDLETELLSRFMKLTGVTVTDAFAAEVPIFNQP